MTVLRYALAAIGVTVVAAAGAPVIVGLGARLHEALRRLSEALRRVDSATRGPLEWYDGWAERVYRRCAGKR